MSEIKLSLTKRRIYLIQMYYRYCLMNNDVSYIKQDILDETQGRVDAETTLIANNIAEKYNLIKYTIKKLLSENWKWDRIPAYIKSVLIVGTYEIMLSQTPKAVTINEMLKIVKENMPDFDYKFVNALLDKVNKD